MNSLINILFRMPSSVRVRVVEARDLPEMDRTVRGEFCTDAYVDIKFRNYEQVQTHTYSVCALVLLSCLVLWCLQLREIFPL